MSDLIHSAIRSKKAYDDPDGELGDFITSDQDTQLFFQRKGDTVYVTFRGTSSFKDVITDMNIRTIRIKDKIRVHEGFYNQFKSVEIEITKRLIKHIDAKNIIFTGHSLGGALAQLAAAYYGEILDFSNVICHTFGSPRVGNKYFVEWFSKHVDENIRVENNRDPVPMIPQFPYWHHTTNTCISVSDTQEKEKTQDTPWFKRPFKLFKSKLSEHDCELYITRVKTIHAQIPHTQTEEHQRASDTSPSSS